MKNISKKLHSALASYFLFFILMFSMPGLTTPVLSQDFPEPMNPPRMVNDFSGFLGSNEAAALEKKLQDFYYSSSTQIYIIVVDDLKGYDPADYATRIGEKWGVGTKGKDNGIVILVKPKTQESMGEVFIAPGYGLEGAVPDITANHIVQEEIIPHFRQGDFYGGLDAATTVLIDLTRGEYSADEYSQRVAGRRGGTSVPGLIFIIFIILAIFGGGRGSRRNRSVGRNLPFWLLLGMMGSGSRSHGGSWGGFSGGSGGFGGFGGGGGGSFGGGGASGGW